MLHGEVSCRESGLAMGQCRQTVPRGGLRYREGAPDQSIKHGTVKHGTVWPGAGPCSEIEQILEESFALLLVMAVRCRLGVIVCRL